MAKAKKPVNSKVSMQKKRRRRQVITSGRIIKYGLNSFVRNAWLSVAATIVMTITLLIIFGSLVARTVLVDTVEGIKDKVDISVYIKKDASNDDVKKMEKSILALESVRGVQYVSPEEARDNFASRNSSDEDIRAALIEAENEFFGVLNVKLVDIGDTEELKNLVDTDKNIKAHLDPDHPPTYAGNRKDAIDSIANSISFAENIGILAGTIFTVIASLIIFNTVRMAIFNRREEIYMMKLIGANKSFIRGPFIVESVVYGVIAAILATGLGYLVISLAKDRLEAYGVIVAPLAELLQAHIGLVILAMMGTGSLIGVLSSWTATRQYLDD